MVSFQTPFITPESEVEGGSDIQFTQTITPVNWFYGFFQNSNIDLTTANKGEVNLNLEQINIATTPEETLPSAEETTEPVETPASETPSGETTNPIPTLPSGGTLPQPQPSSGKYFQGLMTIAGCSIALLAT